MSPQIMRLSFIVILVGINLAGGQNSRELEQTVDSHKENGERSSLVQNLSTEIPVEKGSKYEHNDNTTSDVTAVKMEERTLGVLAIHLLSKLKGKLKPKAVTLLEEASNFGEASLAAKQSTNVGNTEMENTAGNNKSLLQNEFSVNIEDIQPTKEDSESSLPEKSQKKREQRTRERSASTMFSKRVKRPKSIHISHRNEALHFRENPLTKEAHLSKDAPYPMEAPYPQKVPYPDSYSLNYENDFGNGSPESDSNRPSQYSFPVATDIDIRRAVPFENDYISRRYASKFHYPPIDHSARAPSMSLSAVSAPLSDFSNDKNSFSPSSENNDFLPRFPPTETYSPLRKVVAQRFQSPRLVVPQRHFLANSADELNRFRNLQGEISQRFAADSTANHNINRSTRPQGFIPWIPSENKKLLSADSFNAQQMDFPQTPSRDFNVEVSEIGEPAFIIPENLGKVRIIIPPPSAPFRTHGLSINDAQITRNEVRKDNGEFLSSYTTSDGTSRSDFGSLVPTADGDQVLVLKGSYSFTTPEGLKFRVDYTADDTGFHATQVPVTEDSTS